MNVRKNLTFTIKPPADAHGFAREICRLRAAQIRRGKRQSKENFVVCYSIFLNPVHRSFHQQLYHNFPALSTVFIRKPVSKTKKPIVLKSSVFAISGLRFRASEQISQTKSSVNPLTILSFLLKIFFISQLLTFSTTSAMIKETVLDVHRLFAVLFELEQCFF